jgi:hypothetical protein
MAWRISPTRSARLWAAPASAVRPSMRSGVELFVNSRSKASTSAATSEYALRRSRS